MRPDHALTESVSGDWQADRRRQPTLGATSIKHLADSADMDRVVLDGVDEGLFELGGAHLSEQEEQSRRAVTDIALSFGDEPQEGRAHGSGLGQVIQASVLAGSGLSATSRSRWALCSICCSRSQQRACVATTSAPSRMRT